MNVRTTLRMVALAMILPSSVAAQQSRLGLRAGLLASDIASDVAPNGDRLGDTEGASGFTFGAFFEQRGSRFFGRVEANYAPRGFVAVDAEPGAEIEASLDYLEIPLLFGARLGSGVLVPSLYAGPWVAFEVSCSLTARAGTLEQDVDCDDPDGLTERRTTDWGVAVGAGLEYEVTERVGLFVDARWTPGLGNLDTAPDNENVNAKSRSWVFAAGASFRIGGS